ncbi:RNA-dependent RNA polymerase [Enteropsectra breve]|nr:RNA-dependent RNA polymerase [Enteropsectra breve]
MLADKIRSNIFSSQIGKNDKITATILQMVEKDMAIYYNSPLIAMALLKEWESLVYKSSNSLCFVIVSDRNYKNYFKYFYKTSGSYSELKQRSTKRKYFVSLSEFSEILTPADIPEIATVVFFDVEEVDHLMELLSLQAAKLQAVAHKHMITSIPELFSRCYAVDKSYFSYCIPPRCKNTFYKEYFSNSEIIYHSLFGENTAQSKNVPMEIQKIYNDADPDLDFSSSFVDMLAKGLASSAETHRAHYFAAQLLKNDIFFGPLFHKVFNIDICFISEKLLFLTSLIRDLEAEHVVLYAYDINTVRIIYSALCHWLGVLVKQINLPEDPYFSWKVSPFVLRTTQGALNQSLDKRAVTIWFATKLTDLNSVPQDTPLVMYDYAPDSYRYKRYILASKAEKEYFKNLINGSIVLENEILPELKKSEQLRSDLKEETAVLQEEKRDALAALNDPSMSKNSVYGFKVLSNKHAEAVKLCRDKRWIRSVKKCGRNELAVQALCGLGKFQTAKNIHSTTGMPVLIPCETGIRALKFIYKMGKDSEDPKFMGTSEVMLRINKVSFGVISSYYKFFDPHAIKGCGLVHMKLSKRMHIYLFSSKQILRIEISHEQIEANIVVGTAECKKGERSDKTEHALFNDVEISFPLSTFASVYVAHDIPSTMVFSLAFADLMEYFDSLNWRRASINECPYITERCDIKISIPVYQDHIDFTNGKGELLTLNTKTIMDRPTAKATLLFNSIVSAINSYFYRSDIYAVYSKMADANEFLSTERILDTFQHQDYEVYYKMLCIATAKNRYLKNATQAQIEGLLHGNVMDNLNALDLLLSKRSLESVENEAFSCLQNGMVGRKTDGFVVKTATITPFQTVFGSERIFQTNRLLRNFDHTKFLKLSLREENGNFFSNLTPYNNQYVYEYFRKILIRGLTAGKIKYFFLALSSSQLRQHNAWLITPYQHNGHLIGADYIKKWVGDFQDIKNIGKYVVRIGQALSTTVDTKEISSCSEISDIERDGYCFTDGIGAISYAAASEISKMLNLNTIPSAYQIRYGGYKGVVVLHSFLSIGKKDSAECTGIKRTKVSGGLSDSAEEMQALLESNDLVLRPSMKKFSSSYKMLEVINYSKSSPFYLNRQIILGLEGLGVPRETFLEMLDSYLIEMLEAIDKDFSSFIRRSTPMLPRSMTMDQSFTRKVLGEVLNRTFEELNSKAKIRINEGRAAMGVTDELGILEEEEAFVMFEDNDSCFANDPRLVRYGKFSVPVGQAIVVKNPCMHPGDIRVIKLVDRKQLHYLKDVIVFSQKGERPIFNKCSGSDLDGDVFMVSWSSKIIPRVCFKPYKYVSENALSKETVLHSDMINFYVKYMQTNQLGVIANSHMAIADRNGIFSQQALRLSAHFNRNIDFVKTGSFSIVPDDLTPDEYPDYMERMPSYESRKTLGYIYRRTNFDFIRGGCECARCTTESLSKLNNWQARILRGIKIYAREYVCDSGQKQEDSELIYNSYKNEINSMIRRNGAKTEESLFTTTEQSLQNELKALILRYRALTTSAMLPGLSACSKDKIESLFFIGNTIFKTKIKKYLYKNEGEANDDCQLNSALSVSDCVGGACKLCKADQKNAEDRDLVLHVDSYRLNQFIAGLDPERLDIFKEIFTLLLTCRLYTLLEGNEILGLLCSIEASMARSTRLECSKALLKIVRENLAEEDRKYADPTKKNVFESLMVRNNNLLFRIAFLVALDFSVVEKAKMLISPKQVYKFVERPCKFSRQSGLILNGMLDENEEVEFVRRNGSQWVPVLKNKGECGSGYYRDTLRDFLVGILWNKDTRNYVKCRYLENEVEMADIEAEKRPVEADAMLQGCAKQNKIASSVLFELIFTPGIFYINEMKNELASDSISVKELEYLINIKKDIKTVFMNNHRALQPERMQEFLNSVEKMSARTEKYIFEFSDTEGSFAVEYNNDVVERIIRNKKLVATNCIVNAADSAQHNDLLIEMYRGDILYDKNIQLLSNEEMFLVESSKFVRDDKNIKIMDSMKNYHGFKAERNIMFHNKDHLYINYKTVFSGEFPLLTEQGNELSIFARKEWYADTKSTAEFDKCFSKLWRTYTSYLHK